MEFITNEKQGQPTYENMESNSMITDSVWVEMHRIKGYLRQIELYTDRKRNRNRVINIIIIISSIVCAVASFFHEVPYIPWISILAALVVAIVTCLKELMPQFIQPERELCELDNIHSFYSTFLDELEHLYIERFDIKSDVNDNIMNERLYQLQKTEGDRVTRINILCRNVTEEEKIKIKDETESYFKAKYNNKKQ